MNDTVTPSNGRERHSSWKRWVIRLSVGIGSLILAAGLVTGGAAFATLRIRAGLQQFQSDMGRIVAANGVDTQEYVTLGGARQWITVRGQDRHQPILLFLHGGPGGALADESYLFQRPWEDYFTVVQWDQRGFGRSAVDAKALRGTVSKAQMTSDAIELIELLRKRFEQPKVVLVGQSWGTVLGLEIAKRRPDLLYALVSIGQVTAWEANFEETRRLLIARATQSGDAALARTLTDLGPVPSSEDTRKFVHWVFAVQSPMTRLGYSWHNYQGPGDSWDGRLVTAGLMSPSVSNHDVYERLFGPRPNEADFLQVIRSAAGWDAARDVGSHFEVPIVMIAGHYDWQTPITRAKGYFDQLCAPYKVWVEFPQSAHVVTAEEPGRMIVTLVEEVLPATRGERPAGAAVCENP